MVALLKPRYREESSFEDTLAAHPDFPRLVALKIDVQRRGVFYTPRAEAAVDPAIHQLRSPYIFGSRDGVIKPLPESLLLRDGSTILVDPTPLEQAPYTVDYRDGRFVLLDEGRELEEVDLWPKPAYYDKQTSTGLPMSHIISARPQRLNVFQSSFCYFWAENEGCRFCDIVTHTKQQRDELGVPNRLRPQDVKETLAEAIKEPGRFTNLCLTAGSVIKGKEIFDLEVDFYIELLQAIGENFTTKKFPSQLIGSAFNERQLRRLYEETGLSSYTSDLEVLNEELFNWICPGKAKHIGYKGWRDRLIGAVDIFGRGNVGTGIVGGVEMAQPLGFKSEKDALESTLSEAEYLAERGVTTVYIAWVPRPGSAFAGQKAPSLDYFIRLARGLQDLRIKYGLSVDFDDYRRCGNHPDTDLARI
ncbi:radical SAM protein [Uliginosibacterium sp. 31-16]|uniref:radical SAM protein n=1 Tax=Uliginosibacterium sp. 31-16 TaxID=3068315 RepID=UPI0027402C54|nr:radical SAM protein [Uliginosibacterium sp. 31-16]MDP5240810.1 radical SAM protein [Uliginosibacterium sp. 31-16]